MKRLIRLAAYLYPAAWRARYGREFEALLEDDANPRGTDVLNVLRAALKMQMTHLNFWKVVVGCAVAGVVLAVTFGLLTVPDRHRVTGVLSIPAGTSTSETLQYAFSRTVLAELINGENLYTSERNREPLEDVIEGMRAKDLRAHLSPSTGAVAIEFDYPDAAKASSTVKSLAAKMQSRGGLKVLEVSEKLVAPNRMRIASFGLLAGLLAGVLFAGAMRMRGKTLAISGACGAAGFFLAGAASFFVPNTFISSAVLRTADPAGFQRDALSRENLAAIVDKRDLYRDRLANKSMDQLIQTVRENLKITPVAAPSSGNILQVSFVYQDRFIAQRVVDDVLHVYKQRDIEVIDRANLPASPIFPNRSFLAFLGLALGLLSGGVFARVRRPVLA